MKFMNLKRFGATVMAGVMAVSMAVPAFASGQTVIVGTYEDIPIAVTVPEEGTAQINPYGLPVNVKKSDDSKVQITDQQITSMPLSIKNQGTVPLDVDASFKVVPKGAMEIAASKDTGKKAKVNLEVAGLNDAALKLKTDDTTLNDKLIDKFANDASWTDAESLTAPAATAANASTVKAVKSTDNGNTTPLATLGAATVENDGGIAYGAKSIALFRLKGDMAMAPTKTESGSTVDDPWTAADGFTATIVFSFKPAAKMAITLPTGLPAGASVTASPASAWEGTEVTLSFTPPTANTTHVPTYTVIGTADNTKTVTVTNGKFTMPDYAVTVQATFAAP